MKFLEEEIEVIQASEPTDIIWENREFSHHMRSGKACVVWILIWMMLAVSFSIIFKFTVEANKAEFMFPVVNCKTI